jgi:hypothetical protein
MSVLEKTKLFLVMACLHLMQVQLQTGFAISGIALIIHHNIWNPTKK